MTDDKRDTEPEEAEEESGGNGALLGVLFAVALTAGALFLMNRMQHYASLLDCAFTHAPKCRELIKD